MEFEGGLQGVVIVISAFMCQVFTHGVSGTIGVYNIELLENFEVSATEVSLVGALNFAVFLGSGPIISYLMTKFRYRKIVLGGSVLIVFGLLVNSWFANLYMMYLTIGGLVGFGSCCAYIPSYTLCGLYYEKYRSVASGIAASGGGFGYAVMPVLTGLFIEAYTWKGSFILLAGVCLHLFVFGALLRSPPSEMSKGDDEDGSKSQLLQNNATSYSKSVLKSDVCGTLNESSPGYDKFTTDVFGSMIALDENDDKLSDQDCQVRPHMHNQKLQNNQSTTTDKKVAKHIHIFKNFNFVIFFINNYFWSSSICMRGAFVPEYLRTRGYPILEVSRLVGFVGFGTFFGGLFGGFIGNIKGINRIILFIFSCFVLGLFILLIPFGQRYTYYAGVMVCAGVALGIMLGLLMVVLADLIGVENLGNGMGYLMLSHGVGTLTGPVIGGMLIDTTKSYELPLYVSGTLSLLAGASMCLIPLREHFQSCKKMIVPIKSSD